MPPATIHQRSPAPGAAVTPPLRRWPRAVVAAGRGFGRDQIPQVAAGVTFFLLLAVFPALSAFVSIYGLFNRVDQVRSQVTAMGGVLPGGALRVLGDQLTRLASMDHGALSLALGVSVAASIWSANAGVKALIRGLDVANEVEETRGFIGLTLVSLVFTVCIMAAALVGAALLAAAPALLARLGLGAVADVSLARWPALLVAATVAFATLYSLAPDRPRRWRWITPGALAAAAAWLAMSGLFTWYVANFGHYDKTYGSLGAIFGFMTWTWLSVMVLLFGAELDAQLERRAQG